MKTLVAYYSRKRSNEFLAKRISDQLNADIEEIRPRANAFLFFMLNINFGIKRLKLSVSDYDRIILVGPIFMGRFIPPLKSFLKNYKQEIKSLVFVTCCGSTYAQKDDKFGHGIVFKQVKEMMGDKLVATQAFPIGLVLPDEQKDDSDAFMKTHLNDSNFKGEIATIFDEFIKEVG